MLATSVAILGQASPGRVVDVASYEKLGVSGSSALYAVHAASDEYVSGPVQLLDLHGSRHDQGYAIGELGSVAAKANYDALLATMIDTKTAKGILEKLALEKILDWQWSSFLSHAVAGTPIAEELAGFVEGCYAALPAWDKGFCKHAAS